eukprot:778150-Rhodomonas_salina.2
MGLGRTLVLERTCQVPPYAPDTVPPYAPDTVPSYAPDVYQPTRPIGRALSWESASAGTDAAYGAMR